MKFVLVGFGSALTSRFFSEISVSGIGRDSFPDLIPVDNVLNTAVAEKSVQVFPHNALIRQL